MQFLVRSAVSVGAFWSIDGLVFHGVHFDAAWTVLGYVLAGMIQFVFS